MKIYTVHFDNVAILSVNGRLDSVTASQLLVTIEEQVSEDYTRLVIDLHKVNFLNTIGIKALLQGAELARQQGGDIRLANAKTHVKYALTLAGVDTFLKLYPTVVWATASYFSELIR